MFLTVGTYSTDRVMVIECFQLQLHCQICMEGYLEEACEP